MDLEGVHPHYLEYRKYLGNFSQHNNDPQYTISRSNDDPANPGRPLPRQKTASDHFGPGHYPLDCNFPGPSRNAEVQAGYLTRSAHSHKFIFPKENRADSALKMYPGRESPGPALYHQGQSAEDIDALVTRAKSSGKTDTEIAVLVGNAKAKGCGPHPALTTTRQPEWSIPQNLKGTGRPLPRSKTAGDDLGPGTYDYRDKFSTMGWRKTRAIQKLAKKNKDHWAAPQYSLIFKRGSASSCPALPAAVSGSRK